MKSIKKKLKTVRTIKNPHSEEEMQEKGKQFVAHKQLSLSLENIFRLESEKQKHSELTTH